MKPIAATVTGACFLISSAGVVLADNPHNPVTGTGTKGQPGAFNTTLPVPHPPGNTCGSIATTGTQAEPGNGTGVKSPFNTTGVGVAPNYAGNSGNPTAPGGTANNSPHAVSEYDVACFQATQHQAP